MQSIVRVGRSWGPFAEAFLGGDVRVGGMVSHISFSNTVGQEDEVSIALTCNEDP